MMNDEISSLTNAKEGLPSSENNHVPTIERSINSNLNGVDWKGSP